MTKTVLVVRLHSLGHGRMDEDVRKFEVVAEHGLHDVLAKIARTLNIEGAAFSPYGYPDYTLHRDVGKVSEYVSSDDPWHVEIWSTRDTPGARETTQEPCASSPCSLVCPVRGIV